MTYEEARVAGLACYGEWWDQVESGKYQSVPCLDSLSKPYDDDNTVIADNTTTTIGLDTQWTYEGHERYRALQLRQLR